MLAPSEKIFFLTEAWPGREYTWGHIWKQSLPICFESYQDIPCSHRQSRKRVLNTLLMVNITFIYMGCSLEEKSIMFTYSYLMQGKKMETRFVSPASINYFGIFCHFSVNKFTKKHLLVKYAVKYVFFTSLAMKIAVAVS